MMNKRKQVRIKHNHCKSCKGENFLHTLHLQGVCLYFHQFQAHHQTLHTETALKKKSKVIQNSVTSLVKSLQSLSPVFKDSMNLDLWCCVYLQWFLADTNKPHGKYVGHHGTAQTSHEKAE